MSIRRVLFVCVMAWACALPLLGCNKGTTGGDTGGSGTGAGSNTTAAE